MLAASLRSSHIYPGSDIFRNVFLPASMVRAFHTAFGARCANADAAARRDAKAACGTKLRAGCCYYSQARIQQTAVRPQQPTMPDFPVNPEAFPTSTRNAAGDVDGIHTDVMVLRFADKIMVTISQGGRLAHWVRLRLPGPPCATLHAPLCTIHPTIPLHPSSSPAAH